MGNKSYFDNLGIKKMNDSDSEKSAGELFDNEETILEDEDIPVQKHVIKKKSNWNIETKKKEKKMDKMKNDKNENKKHNKMKNKEKPAKKKKKSNESHEST